MEPGKKGKKEQAGLGSLSIRTGEKKNQLCGNIFMRKRASSRIVRVYKKKRSKIASSCLKEHDSDKGRGSLWWVFKDGKEQDMFMCRDAKYKLQGAAEMKGTSSTVSAEGQDAV